MFRNILLLTLSSFATASVIQYPLGVAPSTDSLISKPLVSSDAIQDDITSDGLLKRAEHLFKLAELSFDEYNHPTRVIGSKGESLVLLHCLSIPEPRC
jgi:aminopeptidase Y